MTEHLAAIGSKKTYAQEMKPCEACGHDGFRPLLRRGRIGRQGEYGSLLTQVCERCGFKMQNPRYEDAFYQDYYQQLYREVAFGGARPSDEYVTEQKTRGAGVLAWVKSFGVPPGCMLDHGCASGATMIPWIEAGWRAVGVDPHRPSVETGRNDLDLDVHVGAGEDLPFQDGEFDLVLSLGSLEHVYDFKLAMNELRRVLKPQGVLIIRWRTEVIFGSPLEYYNHNHYRFFTPKTWNLALARYGFAPIGETKQPLERLLNYSYLAARREDVVQPDAVAKLLASGQGEDAGSVVAGLENLAADYFRRCNLLLAEAEKLGRDPDRIADAIRGGRIEWRINANFDNARIVGRALMEAERFITEYKSGALLGAA